MGIKDEIKNDGDYHDVMTPRLKELGGWLAAQSGDSSVKNRVYVDTGAIMERDHAASAGFGFVGKLGDQPRFLAGLEVARIMGCPE